VTISHRISVSVSGVAVQAGTTARRLRVISIVTCLALGSGCEEATTDTEDTVAIDSGSQIGGDNAQDAGPPLPSLDGGSDSAAGAVGPATSADSGAAVDAHVSGTGSIDAGVDAGRPVDAGRADAAATADARAPGQATFHVFLLLGQSNMAGYPKAQQADRAEDPRIKVLGYDNCSQTGRQTDKWDTASPPLHECWNNAIGPGDYFAKTLIEFVAPDDTIGLVPCAISGEKIETFMKVGGNKYSWIVQRAKLAQQAGGVIEGMLFHQGESNNGDKDWPRKVNTLVTDLRSDLGLGNVPFIAGELLYSGGTAGHNTWVNQLPNVVSNGHVVSASGLVVDPADTQWNLHFSHDSQVTFGKRYAEKMKAVLGW
jgi:hypothetical protein